jgi:hypothetical protein
LRLLFQLALSELQFVTLSEVLKLSGLKNAISTTISDHQLLFGEMSNLCNANDYQCDSFETKFGVPLRIGRSNPIKLSSAC